MVIAKLAEKVLFKLGRFDQELDEADRQRVVDAYRAVYLGLLDDGLVTWAYSDSDEADIPDRFSLPLTDLIKAELADGYGLPEPVTGWDRFKLTATNRIRRQLASAQPTEPVPAEYF